MGAKVGDELYKTSSAMLCERLRKYVNPSEGIKKEYNVLIDVAKGKNITAQIQLKDGQTLLVDSNIMPDKSVTKSLDASWIVSAFSKTCDEPFSFKVICNIEPNLYVSMSSLNELRRLCIAKVKDYILKEYIRDEKDIKTISEISKTNVTTLKPNVLYVYNFKDSTDYISRYEKKYNSRLDILYLNFCDVLKYEEQVFSNISKVDIYIVLSNFNLANTAKLINLHLERLVSKGIKGIVIGDIGYLQYAIELKQKYGITLVADYTLNTINSYTAKFLKDNLIDRIAVNIETSESQIDEISKVCDVEVIEDLCVAMTSRYCILGSFVDNAIGKCSRPCISGDYTLVDGFGKVYNVLCDNIDCVMKLVRNKPKYSDYIKNKYTIRHSML